MSSDSKVDCQATVHLFLHVCTLDCDADHRVPPDAKWGRCPRGYKPLDAGQLQRLTLGIQSVVIEPYPRSKYYCFAERVCKAYAEVWSKEKDVLHLNRENLARAAVSAVFTQINPWTDKPHSGS